MNQLGNHDAQMLPGLAEHMTPRARHRPAKRSPAPQPSAPAPHTTAARPDLPVLHQHQADVLDQLREAFRQGHQSPMLQAATGFGKTVIALHLTAGALAKQRRVVFCAPSITLIDQTAERFIAGGIDPADIGVLQADHPWTRPHAPVQIASLDTLARRMRPTADLVIVDEAHRRSKVIDGWIANARSNGGPKFVGLSATPWSAGLGKVYDTLVKGPSVDWLIEHGFLSKFRVFAPSAPDLSAVRTVAGEFHEGDLAAACNRPQLVADVVSTWLARARDLPTLVFAVNRLHAKALAEQFNEAGVAVAYVDANTPREERTHIGQQLASGEVQVVVHIGTLTTGVDWDVRALILARPTKSESLYVQIIGRALRTAPGKTEALILDHSDTTSRLGLPTDIDRDGLDMGRSGKDGVRPKTERGPALPKCCPACSSIMPIAVKTCLDCGHTMPIRANVDVVEGELVEVGVQPTNSKVRRTIDIVRDMGRDTVFAQLRAMQIEKQHSDGWTSHKFRELFQVWPPDRLKEVPPACPTPELRAWVRNRNIAFHANRQREAAYG